MLTTLKLVSHVKYCSWHGQKMFQIRVDEFTYRRKGYGLENWSMFRTTFRLWPCASPSTHHHHHHHTFFCDSFAHPHTRSKIIHLSHLLRNIYIPIPHFFSQFYINFYFYSQQKFACISYFISYVLAILDAHCTLNYQIAKLVFFFFSIQI